MLKCPYLPSAERFSGVGSIRRHGMVRSEEFYLNALKFAQWQWMRRKPAQAILQINKALSADLQGTEDILRQWPWPYEALRWILEQACDGTCGFLGNPVRHFQHLATRMTGVRREIRIERAWVCFWIVRRVLQDKKNFPMDGRQMVREGIFIFPDPHRKFKSTLGSWDWQSFDKNSD